MIFWLSIGGLFVLLMIIGFFARPRSRYSNEPEQQNHQIGQRKKLIKDENDPENADGVKGHLENVGESVKRISFYLGVKRVVDVLLSFILMVVLSPLMLVLALCIFFDDFGPVIFTQKRVGENKAYFKFHKFRTMKTSTPSEVPTHMLTNPDQYMTRAGKWIQKMNLDELPQLWDIFIGNMSFVGPRPALWNQEYLISERDRYGANDVPPGITGWAQINGRDKLRIPEKAKLDGEYVRNMGLMMDLKCIFGTIPSLIRAKKNKE